MERALQLALNGEGRVSPNPMVGAVIVNRGKIIGEGFHAFYGGPHAEVNAINSVKPEDKHLLKDSTIYVTLEPCAHHGKTPPCANLIVNTGIPNVVIGSLDPNPLVAGKGVKILEDAGINVRRGIKEKECVNLNCRFMKAQICRMPFITLKWAQSADGYLANISDNGQPEAVKFSSPLSSVWMHRERSRHDAIMVGGNTERLDNPQLNVRKWGGNSPQKFIAHFDKNLEKQLMEMRKEGVTSLLVEGGSGLLNSFIENGWWDRIRVETSPIVLGRGLEAPKVPQDARLEESDYCGKNLIQTFKKVNQAEAVNTCKQ